ncbi:15836_t:CDS:2, partial [Acaulospora colombiana]
MNSIEVILAASQYSQGTVEPFVTVQSDGAMSVFSANQEEATADSSGEDLEREGEANLRELKYVIETLKGIEDRFNRQFHYSYVFLNEEPFTEHFK